MEVSSRHMVFSVGLLFIAWCLGGKSAILTGITVGLGGKASVTGRGTGMKTLIREGQR